uniref:Uncharacterized protein n=1 Tax=Peronospora matthiolae TaxID=2874970 RepID=A0AAV1VHR4_9STRA
MGNMRMKALRQDFRLGCPRVPSARQQRRWPGLPKGLGLLPAGHISHQYVSEEDEEPIEVRPSKRPALSSMTRTSFNAPRWCDSMNEDDQNEADEVLTRATYLSAASLMLFNGNHWKTWRAKICPSYRFPEPYAIGGRLLINE